MNRCVQFEAAAVFHGAVPTCVPRTAATVAPCVADVDRVHEGGLCGDIRQWVCDPRADEPEPVERGGDDGRQGVGGADECETRDA